MLAQPAGPACPKNAGRGAPASTADRFACG